MAGDETVRGRLLQKRHRSLEGLGDEHAQVVTPRFEVCSGEFGVCGVVVQMDDREL
ncbi:hypothetical protein GCM10028857_03630 [Salinarchaeum chitinilyticum]